MHLLQCCNVGDVLGGTAACAWSLALALKGWRHTVGFFGAVTDETRRAFGDWEVLELGRLEGRDVRRLGADAVVLHNTPGWRVLGPLPAVTLVYLHSHFLGAYVGDAAAYCSRWLARRYGGDERFVLYQGVDGHEERCACDGDMSRSGDRNATLRDLAPDTRRPPTPALPHKGGGGNRRRRRTSADGPEGGGDGWGGATAQAAERGARLVVGRLCSAQKRKWPGSVVEFYADLARRLPEARWEFVGCPPELRGRLAAACRGRAVFLAASREARGRLREWDVWCYSNPGLAESFGRVCAEAMLAGCVPVVDRLGGFCEQVEDGVSGFLCGSAGEFAAALERLCDRSVLGRVSVAGRERAERTFGLRAFGRRVIMWLEAAAQAGLDRNASRVGTARQASSGTAADSAVVAEPQTVGRTGLAGR